MSENTSQILTSRKPWGRELYMAFVILCLSFFYLARDGFNWWTGGFVLAAGVVFLVLLFRRHHICSKIFFEKEHMTLHFNHRTICLPYYEIKKLKIVQLNDELPVQISLFTNSGKAFVLTNQFFSLKCIRPELMLKMRNKHIDIFNIRWFVVYFLFCTSASISMSFYYSLPWHVSGLFLVPLLYCAIRASTPRGFRGVHWHDFLPTLRGTTVVQLGLVALCLTMVNVVEKGRAKADLKLSMDELRNCQLEITTDCHNELLARVKIAFGVDENGFTSIKNEVVELTLERQILINILDKGCDMRLDQSCFLLSLIHAKMSNWAQSVAYFERSLAEAQGQTYDSMLGEKMAYEKYYISRYGALNKGSRVLASEEFRAMAHRHKDLKIEVTEK